MLYCAEQCEVEEVRVEVGPGGVVGAGGVRTAAARWRVCGHVSPPEQRRVLLAANHDAALRTHVTPQPDGQFISLILPLKI